MGLSTPLADALLIGSRSTASVSSRSKTGVRLWRECGTIRGGGKYASFGKGSGGGGHYERGRWSLGGAGQAASVAEGNGKHVREGMTRMVQRCFHIQPFIFCNSMWLGP